VRPSVLVTMCGRGRRTAFTLVELLVVSAIIALLVAILLPSIGRARAQARTALCLSNLHELQTAAQMYSSQYRGALPAFSDPGKPSWPAALAGNIAARSSGTGSGQPSVDRVGVLHCPERQSKQSPGFVDYVANAMNPNGPDADGLWTKLYYLRSESYKRSSQTIYLADAEREDMVVHIGGHPGGETVKDAHDNWTAGLYATQPTLSAMTVWTGSHLPEGKDCVNVTDEPGVRRVARRLHPSRFTNASFLDGHASGAPPAAWPVDASNYGVWLSRYGVKDPETVKTLPIQ
jgi:prepilin-type N-terminal cleavage/methylation domain-containing protein/prepilin-type processing-associated H-X9-DG protein